MAGWDRILLLTLCVLSRRMSCEMTIKGLPRPSASLSLPCHAVVPSDPMSMWQAMRGRREEKLARWLAIATSATMCSVVVAPQQGF